MKFFLIFKFDLSFQPRSASAISSDSRTRFPNIFLLASSTNLHVVDAILRTLVKRFAMQNDAMKNIWGNLPLLGDC